MSNLRQAMQRLLVKNGWRQTYAKRATSRQEGYAVYSSDNIGRIDVRDDGWSHYYKSDVFGTSLSSSICPIESLRNHLWNLPAHTWNFASYSAWKKGAAT